MSKLDYCNITLAILPSHDLGSLQSAINAATHLSQCTAAQPLTPLLADLQWLRMPQHIQCKLCVLVYQCTHGSAPSYLKMPSAQSQAKNHGVVCALRHWPISSYWHCDVQRWATVCRRRSTACLDAWNNLPNAIHCRPNAIHCSLSLATFKHSLKTYFYTQCFYQPCFYYFWDHDCDICKVTLKWLFSYNKTETLHCITLHYNGSSSDNDANSNSSNIAPQVHKQTCIKKAVQQTINSNFR